MNPITPAELAAYFDHTQLRAYAQRKDFEKLCAEAREYGFAMVAINPAPVSLCKDLLAGTSVHVGAAIGFPLGQSTPQVKKYEAVDAIANGADEIDYVINITQLKEKNYDFIEHEMAGIVEECRSAGAISKVIFENCYLTEEEKRALCSIAREVRPDFIKTSTGFGTGGATFEDVALMKKCPKCGNEMYPSISTAILVLIRKEDKLLLVHARNFKGTFNSLVAGFLETGETLEECVAREVKEETGLDVKNITYFANQPWPYPSGLMVGFIADYAGGELTLQDEELSSGAFYTRDNLPELPRKLSLARKMIDWWIENGK